MSVPGIDVSGYDPPWSSWRDSRGIRFGMVKATEGLDYDNPAFDPNWAAMGKAGLRRFAYHYGHPSLSPSAQAAYVTRVVRAAGLHTGDNYVLDLEESDGMSPVDVSFWAYVFCHEVNRLNPGHRILVYTYPWFAEQGYCAKLSPWGLWIANYQVHAPTIPPPWKSYRLWQYADGNSVDLDEWNGTEAELLDWTATSG